MVTTSPDSGTVTLLDGTEVGFRPIRPSDQAALQRFHGRLSDQSIYQRFFFPKPWLSDEQARYFTELDGIDRFALVALDPTGPEEIAAVVRFDRDPGTDRAEYAAIVVDDWQGHGLGLALTRRLNEAARRRGVTTMYALVLPDNKRMLNLLRDLGLPERVRHEGGVERIEVSLPDEATPA
jgi:RimJ/RimL family protein N-acetyltransferase